MKNTVKTNGAAAYTLHYNKKADTIRVSADGKNLIIVHHPTADEVEYFINGTPTAEDVRSTFLR